jgi:hypothetical protein
LGKIGGDGGIVDVGDIADAGAGFDFFGFGRTGFRAWRSFFPERKRSGGICSGTGTGDQRQEESEEAGGKKRGDFHEGM